MAVSISPVGLATTALVANQVSLLATYTERLCNAVCVNSAIQPQYTVTYTNGTPTLNEGTVFVPITAVITIVTPGCCNNAKTRIYNERFTAAFQGQTAVPTSVTIDSVGIDGNGSGVQCCMASTYTIKDSLTITIA